MSWQQASEIAVDGSFVRQSRAYEAVDVKQDFTTGMQRQSGVSRFPFAAPRPTGGAGGDATMPDNQPP
jgi:hypothetical protein